MYTKNIIDNETNFDIFVKKLDLSEYDPKLDCELVKNMCHCCVAITNHYNKNIYMSKGDWGVIGFKCVDCFKILQCTDNTYVHDLCIREDGSNLRCSYDCIKKYNSKYENLGKELFTINHNRLYYGYWPYLNPSIAHRFGLECKPKNDPELLLSFNDDDF